MRILAMSAALMAVISAFSTFGCGCSAGGLIPGYSDAGTVLFNALPVGQSEVLEIPIQGGEGVETFTSASVMGTDAAVFQVLTAFPLTIPSGASITVEVQFTPAQTGIASASLVLDTPSMGDSLIPLQGTGAAGDGG